jgi:hypothetical protein
VATLLISNTTASTILETALESGTPTEKWQSARCLGSLGVGTVGVIKELLSHLIPPSDDEPSHRNEAIVQLQTVSKMSTLAQSLVSSPVRNRAVTSAIVTRLSSCDLCRGPLQHTFADTFSAIDYSCMH